MNTVKIQSALEVLQRPNEVRALLTSDTVPSIPDPMPIEITKSMAAELVVAIAEHTAEENEKFSTIFEVVQRRNDVNHRDIPELFDYLGKSYQFVKDYWAEIYFIISILNNKGYFKNLKKNSDFKPFFEVFFDEKIKKE